MQCYVNISNAFYTLATRFKYMQTGGNITKCSNALLIQLGANIRNLFKHHPHPFELSLTLSAELLLWRRRPSSVRPLTR